MTENSSTSCVSLRVANLPSNSMAFCNALYVSSKQARCLEINKVFEDAYRSDLSLVVLDNLERLIGMRFSNNILQTLLVLIKKASRAENRRLMVIATGTRRGLLEELELRGAFDVVLSVAERIFRSITEGKSAAISASELKSVCRAVPFPVGIMVFEMFLNEPVLGVQAFEACLASCGIQI